MFKKIIIKQRVKQAFEEKMLNIELQSVENKFHSVNEPAQTKLEMGSAGLSRGDAPGDGAPASRIGFNKAYIFTGFREGFVRAALIVILLY